jgi:regulatory protein
MDSADVTKHRAQSTPRPIPRKVDGAYLERAALYYLERFASSSENLRKVLKRKIDRRCRARGEEPQQFYDLITPLLERYQASGLLNDAVYAQSQVASLRRRGGSKRAISAKLAAKGIKGDELSQIIEQDDTDELQAARNYARRRRLGYWRTKNAADYHDKDLAALARAGFSFQHAKAALEPEEEEA